MTNKYINGIKYDRENSELLAEWDNCRMRGDTDWIDEELRRMTGSSRFFLYGQGGYRTRYAERCIGGWLPVGEGIIPLTDQEARNWAEEHLDADDVDRIFGPSDDTGNQPDTLILDDETLARLDTIALADGLTREGTVKRLIREAHDAISMR